MIAVDSSAFAATVFDEPEADTFRRFLLETECVIAWPTIFECYQVFKGRKAEHGVRFLEEWIERENVRCRPFDSRLFRQARRAFDLFGRRQTAGLNFGDCMSYALAKDEGIPLLFKGDDFAKTDIRPALP